MGETERERERERERGREKERERERDSIYIAFVALHTEYFLLQAQDNLSVYGELLLEVSY